MKNPDIRRVAREKFGYEELRAGQEEAVQALLAGHDVVAILPTGSGKSAIYQIAGSLIPGPTVVISPLIALQRDQVEAVAEADAGEGALVNSVMRRSDRQEALDDLREGDLEFFFIAPEQLSNDETLEHLRAAQPSLFVVDEAHCISEWGHDFRPDYLKIGNVIEELGHPTTLAMTATAAPPVREEIMRQLRLGEPRVIVHGSNRPNIWLGARRCESEETKQDALFDLVGSTPGTGIIYVVTRKRAEEIAGALCRRGMRAAYYHAGMKSREREQAQADFMADEVEVIVATVAFGMGIDKPDVRFVFHYDVSDSLDSYYQEIGRAGRDGEPAKAVLLYNPSDLNLRRFQASGTKIGAEQIEQVVATIQQQEGPVAPEEIAEEADLSQSKLATAIARLEEVGAVETLPSGEIVGTCDADVPEVAKEAAHAQEQHRQFERSRVEMMRGYAELEACRREYLLHYFGEDIGGACGACDNCELGIAMQDGGTQEQANRSFPITSRVTHAAWGEGQVIRYEGDKMVVLFDSVGYKTLAVDLVVENELLQAV